MKKNCGERWKCSYTLKGHSGGSSSSLRHTFHPFFSDVLGLEWSPYDRWLASCSVDNTVVIWDAQNFPQVVQVLRDHTSLVKVNKKVQLDILISLLNLRESLGTLLDLTLLLNLMIKQSESGRLWIGS